MPSSNAVVEAGADVLRPVIAVKGHHPRMAMKRTAVEAVSLPDG
jgi:hypothetical protein